jgi:arylsulfatase A-like enzyme
VKEKLLRGPAAASKTFKVHLDGYNLLPYLTGQADRSARKEFLYFNDDGDLVAMRYENWKIVFMEQRARAPCVCGRSRSPPSACPSCSTCGPTPTSGLT